MSRASLFALVGSAFFVYWWLADPSFEESATQSEWKYVLGFSATLLTLASAIPVFGRTFGGRRAFIASLVAGAGTALAAVANVFEDGLGMSWMFFVTAFGTAITLIALVSLTAAIALAGSAFQRSLALIPAATAAGIVFFVWAGGIIMLIAWSAAAVLALPGRSPEATARCGRR